MSNWYEPITITGGAGGNLVASDAPPSRWKRRGGIDQERRYEEAAETTRLNSAQWSQVTGNAINADIASYLSRIRDRCEHEVARNPILEGVIDTHANDLSGPAGPSFQCRSKDESYNAGLERLVREWRKSPDVRGKMSLADNLRLWVRQLWTCGEFLAQITQDPDATTALKTRLLNLHPKRLATSPGTIGDKNVALGVRRNALGKPTHYVIEDVEFWGEYEASTYRYTELPAEEVIHEFKQLDPDQVRGMPWATTCLQVSADLRDYDVEVLDAARAAADTGVYWYTEHVDAPYMAADATYAMERRTQSTGPPGWKPEMMTPTQPATGYVEFRRERLAELGRPVSMPLMMVLLNSEEHSYSSARFDGQIYKRSLAAIQVWLGRVLDRIVGVLAREAELRGLLPPPPDDVHYEWTWAVPPHVDPEKEADGERVRLENRTLSFSAACAQHGLDPDGVLEQLAADIAKFKVAGVPLPAWITGVTAAASRVPRQPQPDTQEPSNGKASRQLVAVSP